MNAAITFQHAAEAIPARLNPLAIATRRVAQHHQSADQALALVRALLGCPKDPLAPPDSSWRHATVGGTRTIRLAPFPHHRRPDNEQPAADDSQRAAYLGHGYEQSRSPRSSCPNGHAGCSLNVTLRTEGERARLGRSLVFPPPSSYASASTAALRQLATHRRLVEQPDAAG